MTTRTHRSPSEIDAHRGWFDEFAARTQGLVSRDIFFVALVVLTLVWAPSYFWIDSVEHWHLALAVPAEIVTLFMVALLANHDRRSDQALHRKMDAMAAALAAITAASEDRELRAHSEELRAADGLEERESTDDD